MADQVMTNDAILAAGIGGVAGVSGAAVTALSEKMTRKQVFATMISGVGFGSSVPPTLMTFFQFHPVAAGLVGFLCGLSCVALVTGVKTVANTFAKKPAAFIPHIRDAMRESGKEGDNVDK